MGVIIGTLVDDDALVAEAYTSIRLSDRRVIGDASANAELIVRAVNAHAALVEAAENAAESIDYVLALLEETEYLRPARDSLASAALELRSALQEVERPG